MNMPSVSVWGLCMVFTSFVASAANAPPEISGASITAEAATLLYGANFDDAALAVHVESAPQPKKDEKPWGEADLRASLERVLAGKREWPPAPAEKDRGWRKVEHREDSVLLCDTGGNASSYPAVVKALRVRNSRGVSEPHVLNRPEVWGVSPRKLVVGDSATVWGANVGVRFALVRDGKVAAVCHAYQPYCTHSHRPEARFIRLLAVPENLPPGRYALYAWGGFADLGWGEPFEVEIVQRPAPPKTTIHAKEHGIVGDGVSDDTEAIERAIAAAAKAGGGRVALPHGRFVISRALNLPENVQLAGQSPESTILEASRWKAFQGQIPEQCFSRPEGYSPETYKRAGWGVDWVMEGVFKNVAHMVWLQSGSAVENLTLDATNSTRIAAVVLIADKDGKVCRSPVVRNCQILCERMGLYGDWPDYRVTRGILLPSSTEDMVVERTKISVNGVGMEHMPGITRGARIRYNTFTTADPHGPFELWMPRTTQECLIEGNLFENGGRGKTEQAHGFNVPVRRNCYVHNIFRNCNKGDGELLMYETGGLGWFGPAARADATRVTAADDPKWTPDQFKGETAIIVAGRGLGQFRAIASNTADTLTVDTPWRVRPDATSTLAIMRAGVVENLHIGNEFFYCHYYSGIYGSGIRNVWVNEVYESVGGGTFLWPIHGPRLMALNLIYGGKYHERGGIVMTNDRRPDGKPTEAQMQAYQKLPKCFGNEVRGSGIRERSYVSTENGQIWTRSLRYHWARHGRSSPINPLPGAEAAIAVWDTLQWAGYPEEPELDNLPASTRWNLLAENLIVRCPVGILVGKAADRTILASNSFHECGTPVKDLGRNTVVLDEFVHSPSKGQEQR
ncbi:MAG: hypothetical protein FJ279_10065 [Planctomycetes bacterium]|nr:hypothetical protein [Planctomycetota bacterium]